MEQLDFETSRDNTSAFFSRADVLFLFCVAIFLFLQLFILPFTPVYVENDQLVIVSNAIRLLDGEVMYRSFFHLTPPGAELYYAAVFSIFGSKIWVMNATIFVLALGQLFLLFAFSKKTFNGLVVYLPTLLYFVLGFRLFGIDGSNRLFSVIFVLLAAWLVLKGTSARTLIIAAILCGISSFFVQTRGILGIGAIGLYILWLHLSERRGFKLVLRDWVIAGGAFLIAVAITQLPAAAYGGFENYYFANFVFIKDHYGADSLSNTAAYFSDLPSLSSYLEVYGGFGGWFRFLRVSAPTLFFYAIVPLANLAYFAYRRFRKPSVEVDRALMFLSILGTVFYIGVSAPTGYRLYHVSVPAVLVFSWLLWNVVGSKATTALLVLLSILGLAYALQRQAAVNATVDLPAGRAAFLSPPMAEKYLWLKENTKPGDYIFEAQHPTYYFPLGLRNPTPFNLVRDNNYTPDFQVAALIRSLEATPPQFIVWHGKWSKEPGERKPGDNLAPLWELIRTKYELKKEFREMGEFTTNSERDIEIWERLPE